MPLPVKHQAFVDDFIVTRNATHAAIAAGYSEKTARQQGSRLLTNAAIQAAVNTVVVKAAENAEVTAERVIQEYARIAFSDMRHFATVGAGGIDLKDSEEWTDDDAAAVAELGETRTKDGGSVRFKLHSKTAALDSLARYLGLLDKGDQTEDHRSLTIIGSLDEKTLRALAGFSGNG